MAITIDLSCSPGTALLMLEEVKEKTEGGIVKPEIAIYWEEMARCFALCLEVGDAQVTEHGIIPQPCQKGDTVVFSRVGMTIPMGIDEASGKPVYVYEIPFSGIHNVRTFRCTTCGSKTREPRKTCETCDLPALAVPTAAEVFAIGTKRPPDALRMKR